MTRDEHLEFCRKCTNRKMDLQQGLICGITGEFAAFENECPDYIRDEAVGDRPPMEDEAGAEFALPSEVLAAHGDDIVQEFRQHQDLVFAIIGGLLAALVAAVLWAAVTVSTGYQIGYMAIAVGLIVGFSVRYFGAGIDLVYGIIGAVMALLGCMLGNLFSQVVFAADAEGLGYIQTLGLIDFSVIIDILISTFSGMDLLFYGLAIYEGYKFAFRPITEEAVLNQTYEPVGARFRLPLVGVAFTVMAAFMYLVNN